MRPALAFLLAALAAAPAAPAAEVVGTAYTVLLRGHGPRQPAQAQPPQRVGTPGLTMPIRQPQPIQPRRQPSLPATMMRLVDGRTGLPFATANYDATIDGYMFRLPMTIDVGRGDVCLLIKNAAGVSIPVRDERAGDDGYAFRNPAWQAEAGRLGELATLRAEHAGLVADLDKGTREIEAAQAENGGVTQASQCQDGAAQPDPPRPPGALDPADAAARAGAICAVAWERSFEPTRIDPGRLFGEAGLAADWAAREAARPVAQSLRGLRLELRDNDARTIPDAAAKGRAYLEHAEGLRAMVRVHNACKAEVDRLAAGEVRAWQNAVEVARAAPRLARAACEQRIARIDQLRARLAKGPAFRQELERRIATLDAGAPPAADSIRIDSLACKGG